MKKRIIMVALLLIIGGIIGITYKMNSKSPTENSGISIYLQKEVGGKDYDLSPSNEFPTDGYVLNRGVCDNGANVTQNPETKAINVSLTGSTKCTLYFDMEKKEYTSKEVLDHYGWSAQSGSPNFGTVATSGELIYSAPDDYGTSYYLRGAPTHNYVEFANYKWRIVRINGDGSLRMIYEGSGYANGATGNDKIINSTEYYYATEDGKKDDNAYVGYMRGQVGANDYDTTHANTTDSYAKQIIDKWYEDHLRDEYSEYLADEIFCNDRSIDKSFTAPSSIATQLGYAKNQTYYEAYHRVGDSKYRINKPILTCPQKHDAFTVDDTEKGNGDLKYPIGMITADELSMSGMVYDSKSTENYLADGTNYYWSMSPYDLNGGYARVFYAAGPLSSTYVYITRGLRPVINLKSEYAVQLEGTGELSSPYHLPS